MNIIAVDDEYHALKNLERAIQEAVPVCKISCFQKPKEALNFAADNLVDVAFLDANMPTMDGLTLAKYIYEIHSKINIIFVTGYGEYAVDAFSLGSSGYIMKPVKPEAIALEVSRLRNPISFKPRITVQCFGSFEVFVDGKPLEFTYTKTKEMFAYLISRNGAACNNNEIAAVLWEGKTDSPSMQSNLRNLVSDLMRTLQKEEVGDVIIKKYGSIAILTDKLSCDFYEYIQSKNADGYLGEFMTQYSWAEFTNAYLANKQ